MMETIEEKIQSIISCAEKVLRMELDKVVVHPCDYENDDVRASGCVTEIKDLYYAIKKLKGE